MRTTCVGEATRVAISQACRIKCEDIEWWRIHLEEDQWDMKAHNTSSFIHAKYETRSSSLV